MTRPLALVVYAFFTTGLLTVRVAEAKPKVALTQIEGDASGDVREAVVEALEGKELSLISGREVNRAVDKLGDLSDLTEKDFKKLATQLEADAVVAGKLDKVGSSKTLKFRLFVHKKMAKGFTMSFKDASSSKFKALLHDKMLDKIGVTASSEGDSEEPTKKKAGDDEDDPLAKPGKGKKAKKAKPAEDAEADEAKPAKKAKADKAEKAEKAEAEADDKPAKKAKADKADKSENADAEDEPKPSKKAKLSEDDARPAEGDDAAEKKSSDEPRKGRKKVAAAEDGDELEATASASPAAERPHSLGFAPLRVDLGASMIKRSYTFNSTLANTPKNVSLSPVPGARISGEVYPLALSGSGGALAGLGIGGLYDRTISLNVTSNGMTAPIKQSRWEIGVRYRLAFGKSETSPTLTFGIGYGKRLFSPDRTKLDAAAATELRQDVPTTQYTVIDPGVDFRLPVTRSIAFVAGGHGMVIQNAGPIQAGNSYGRAKVYGVDANAGVDIAIGKRFGVRVAAEFAQIGFSFTGDGLLSKNLDNDPSQQDVGGLADRSLGGSATLAVVY